MDLPLADEPHGSSSCPRCRHVFANARAAPSSPRTSSTPPAPVSTAACDPGCGSSDACPTQAHPPPKKFRRSHPNTSADVYAAGGSIRLTDHTVKAKCQFNVCLYRLTPDQNHQIHPPERTRGFA
jgi:hypothetical protein